MKLSILIASIDERADLLKGLKIRFDQMIKGRDVEVISLSDNKQMSIGVKRQRLLEMANGDWIVFFDDDDEPYPWYVDEILKGTETDADCMGINGIMTTNDRRIQKWVHRLGFPIAKNKYGYDYTRPIIHFNPVKREKALQAGFKDMRFGEDFDYAERLNPLLKKEHYITKPLFHYRYTTKIPHNQKYGI